MPVGPVLLKYCNLKKTCEQIESAVDGKSSAIVTSHHSSVTHAEYFVGNRWLWLPQVQNLKSHNFVDLFLFFILSRCVIECLKAVAFKTQLL